MTATTYASLAQFKRRVNVTVSDPTGVDLDLQNILDSAARIIDRETRNPPLGQEAYAATTSAVRLYDHVLRQDGKYPIDDCLTVTAVSFGGTAVQSGYWQLYPLVPGTGCYDHIYIRQDATGVWGVGTVWYQNGVGHAQLSITGTWGYCTTQNLPAEITEATLRRAVRIWEFQNLTQAALMQAQREGRHIPSPYDRLTGDEMLLLERFIKYKRSYAVA